MNGVPWHVQRVGRDSPALVDRTGKTALATTDPRSRVICVAEGLPPERLAHVVAHEVAHACMVSYGMLDDVRAFSRDHVAAEEWACNLVADHGAEMAAATALVLKRW